MNEVFNRCEHCNENIHEASDAIMFGHFSVWRSGVGGVEFDPEDGDWGNPEYTPNDEEMRAVTIHYGCLSNFFDGIYASIPAAKKEHDAE